MKQRESFDISFFEERFIAMLSDSRSLHQSVPVLFVHNNYPNFLSTVNNSVFLFVKNNREKKKMDKEKSAVGHKSFRFILV